MSKLLCLACVFVAVNAECDSATMRSTAKDFFRLCEAGKGWNATKEFVTSESAKFNAEVTDALPGPKLSVIKTVAGYADWMVGVVHEFGPKATVDVKAEGLDYDRDSAVIYAVFAGFSDYAYSFGLDKSTCKIDSMTKIWNDGYAAAQPPPMVAQA